MEFRAKVYLDQTITTCTFVTKVKAPCFRLGRLDSCGHPKVLFRLGQGRHKRQSLEYSTPFVVLVEFDWLLGLEYSF